jgi:hypothetical protein
VGDGYRVVNSGDRLAVKEPFDIEVVLADLLPPWASKTDCRCES